jgi:hypothetical protein
MVYFQTKKIAIWVNVGGSCNERCWYIFYGNLVYFTAISYVLWTFGIFCGNLVPFPSFGILYQENYGNPGSVLSVTSKFGQDPSFYERLVYQRV